MRFANMAVILVGAVGCGKSGGSPTAPKDSAPPSSAASSTVASTPLPASAASANSSKVFTLDCDDDAGTPFDGAFGAGRGEGIGLGETREAGERDIDGDGIADRLTRSRSGGSGFTTTELKLRFSSTNKTLVLTHTVSGHLFVSFAEVPPELVNATELHTKVAKDLVGTVCKRADPSLEWLLQKEHALVWYKGRPAMPDSYALYSEDPKLLEYAQEWLRTEDSKAPIRRPKASTRSA